MEDIFDYAVDEARKYAAGGVDALICENHGDIPFLRPNDIGQETAAAMAVMADRVKRETGLTIGLNVLGNGAMIAIAIAKAAGRHGQSLCNFRRRNYDRSGVRQKSTADYQPGNGAGHDERIRAGRFGR